MLPFRACLFALLVSLSLGHAAAQAEKAEKLEKAEKAAPSEKFDVVKVAEGVYATLRRDSPGLAAEANTVFIINADDVVVVDTNISASSTREVLAALRRLTDKPVRYVVNTHWHDDHVLGNRVYREAFPGVEFVAHARTREYLPTTGLANRNRALAGVPGFLQFLKGQIEKNLSPGGGPLTDEERAAYANDLKIGERFVGETPGTEVVLPTLTLEERLTLRRGERVINIIHLGPGHTGGDIVVHLPREGVVVAGDLVVWPVPYVGAGQSHVAGWAPTLDKLLALRPAVIVPGHGPLLRDDTYVKLVAAMFASVARQTGAAAARGETLEQARKSVSLEEFRKQIAGESQFRNVLFMNYVAGPAVEAAYREATAKRPQP